MSSWDVPEWRIDQVHEQIDRDHLDAAQQARDWVGQDLLIVDTETTGLENDAQIVEIAVVDLAGRVLLDSLVKPTIYIPREASSQSC